MYVQCLYAVIYMYVHYMIVPKATIMYVHNLHVQCTVFPLTQAGDFPQCVQ